MAIQTGTDTVFHTPHEVLQSALADSVLFLEKATVGRAQMSDISEALAEYKRLFSVKLASPAEILTLARAYPDNQKYAKAAEGIEDDSMPVVVGGPASVEMVDREGHLITTNALTKAFKNYMANFRTRNTMVMHSDVQVGWALPAYITKGGSVFRSGVDPRGLFFITELRNDTRIAAKVKDQIESGKMRSYSIAGNATESKDIHKEDGTKIMQVDNLELAEVTICEKGVNQGAHFDLMKGMILDKEQSTYTTPNPNDLLLGKTLSKGIFGRKKPDLSDPKLRESVQAAGAEIDAQAQAQSAKRQKLSDMLSSHASSPSEPPAMSQGMQSAMADIKARRADNEAKAPKIEESLNKSTPMLGMFQAFMEKTKGSTDTPLGLQANHPDQQGEDDRRAQLKRVQEEFGLPEETHSAEYNRNAPVDYKMPHSFSSSRVVNQSGQDSAVAHPDNTLAKETVERLFTLRKAPTKGFGREATTISRTGQHIPTDSYSADTTGTIAPTRAEAIRGKRNPSIDSHRRDAAKTATEEAGLEYASKMQKIDKVLSKLFQKAGQDKEDRTPGNSTKPNEFPADASVSPYQSKGVFEKAGDDLRQDGITNHPSRRSPLTKPEDDRTSKLNKGLPLLAIAARAAAGVLGEAAGEKAKEKLSLSKAGLYENIHARRKSGKRMRSEGDSKAPTDADFKDAAKSLTKDATGTTNRGFRQEGGTGAPDRMRHTLENIRSKPQRPDRYKDIDRTTPRKPVEKAAQTPGTGQQSTPQGPTTTWGDASRSAQPTMRQRMPWDEKSMEKNEDKENTLPSKPSLNPIQAPRHDLSGAAANRARVEAAKGKDAATQYKAPRDPADKIIAGEAKKKKAGWKGFPSPRSSGDFEEKSLLKTNPDPVEEGKAILALPFNLATQMIMGKKAPAAVSSDDRLKEAVLVLLKQQQTAEEVGRDIIGSGAIKVGEQDNDDGQDEAPSTVSESEPDKAKPTANPLPKPVSGGEVTPSVTGKLPTPIASKVGAGAKKLGGAIGSGVKSAAGAAGVGSKAKVDVPLSPTGSRAPAKGKPVQRFGNV